MSNILVIDDDPGIRSLLRRMLDNSGHTIVEAENGTSGLRAAAVSRPDLVITDVLMPDKDGFELIRELKAIDPAIRVIAISGGTTAGHLDVLKLARHLGANQSFWKPFDLAKLRIAIDEELQARSSD